MKNQECIHSLLSYIEEHLYEPLTIEELAKQMGYSSYHLHKLFTGAFEMSIHTYIVRRRLSEAAYFLVQSDMSIIEIALQAGYESQQAFHKAFKGLYHKTPANYRKKGSGFKVQMPLTLSNPTTLPTSYEIDVVELGALKFAGFQGDCAKGFQVIRKCHHNLHKYKDNIRTRVNTDFYVGINDYTNANFDTTQPSFLYFTGIQIQEELQNSMFYIKDIPASRYLRFRFYANPKNSMEPIAYAIYHEYLPYTTYCCSEHCPMDIIFYKEVHGKEKEVEISYLVGID